MGQALYRKYRSKSLAEIVGQEHITGTLNNALQSGRISHAYLFTGPRGVGKTSIARILAHEINGLPYNDDSSHIDIVEIDAASNRRIDEIRDLREKVYVAPTSAKYKVYIIDEVHMLTKEAFNALLKTLEEPPAHAVFILATTDAHKLPDTIISRTQRFTFKPVEQTKVIEHLKHIAATEGLTVDEAALGLLAEHGEGSFRDSISLLDQAANHSGKLSLSDVQDLLGLPSEESITALVAALQKGEPAAVVQALSILSEQGLQASAVAKSLASRIRGGLIEGKPVLVHTQALALLTDLLDIAGAHDPERLLEIVLLKNVKAGPVHDIAVVAAPIPQPKRTPTPQTTPAAKPVDPIAEPPKKEEPALKEEQLAAPPQAPIQMVEPIAVLDMAIWPQILSEVKKKYNTIYGVLRTAQADFKGETLELTFKVALYHKKMTEAKNQQIIIEAIRNVTGHEVTLACSFNKEAKPATAIAEPDLSAISNIFGGGELLES